MSPWPRLVHLAEPRRRLPARAYTPRRINTMGGLAHPAWGGVSGTPRDRKLRAVLEASTLGDHLIIFNAMPVAVSPLPNAQQSVSTPDPDPREGWSVPGFCWPARRSEYDSRTQPFVLFSV